MKKLIIFSIVCVIITAILGSVSMTAFGSGENDGLIIIKDYVTLNHKELSMGAGESYTLRMKLTPYADEETFSWYTSDSAVVNVNSSGNVTAVAPGTATITLRTGNGFDTTCIVTVKNAPSKISLNKSSIKTGLGEDYDLDSYVNRGAAAAFRTYTSSNESVATVDNYGIVTTKSEGFADITVHTYNNITASCKVEVKSAPQRISLNKSSLKLGCGEKYDLDSYVNRGAAAQVRSYKTSNSAIASVNSSGIVTAKSNGKAVVTVYLYNGVEASCAVTACNKPTGFALSKSYVSLKKGGTVDIDSFVNRGAAAYTRKYSSSDKSVATVDSYGIVKAKSDGTATIRCTIYNGLYADCTVSVGNSGARIRTDLDPNKPMVALTFDDGPNYSTTSRVLDALENHGGRATFFVVGNRLGGSNSKVLKRAYNMGCEIGNHTFSHQYLNQVSYSTLCSEISKCNTSVFNATGAYPTAFRCPGGNCTTAVSNTTNLPIFYWSIDTRDWATQDANSTYYSVINNVSDGDIVLMHDIYTASASAAEMIIPKLSSMGYQLVTLHELAYYKGIKLQNGTTYYSIR